MNTIETRTNRVLEDFTKEILLTPEFIEALPDNFIEQQLNHNGINHVVFFKNLQQRLIKPREQKWEKLTNWIKDQFGTGWLLQEQIRELAILAKNTPELALDGVRKLTLDGMQELAVDGVRKLAPAGGSRGKDDVPKDSVRRSKLIELQGKAIVLVVQVMSKEDEPVKVSIKVEPLNKPCLPESLQSSVLDESGVVINDLEQTAGKQDDLMIFDLDGEQGERFSIKVALGSVSIMENFEI